jgi:fido (protein-threonine AMPylation protein)
VTERRTDVRRDSKPQRRELFTNKEEKAAREAANGLLQFDEVVRLVEDSIKAKTFRLRPSTIQALQRIAINGVYTCAGTYRGGPVDIEHTTHVPPDAPDVLMLVEQMCDYVNENWHRSAVHLAAYVMWRVNWIHPFWGGNGRTSRAVSYLVMCTRARSVFPGTKTIPELIIENRDEYYAALDAADVAWAAQRLDVSRMEALLDRLLAAQLLKAHEEARADAKGRQDLLPSERAVDRPDAAAALVSRSEDPKRMTTGTKLGIAALIVTLLTAIIGAYAAHQPPKCAPNDRKGCPAACSQGEGFQICSAEGIWGDCKCAKQ